MPILISTTISTPTVSAKGETRRFRIFTWQTLLSLLGITVALLWVFPLYWMFATSLTPERFVLSRDLSLIPPQITLENYITVFRDNPTLRWFVNSVLTAVSVVAGSLLLGSMAGYALARLHFPGRKLIFWVLIGSLMIPFEMTVIPLFLGVLKLNLQDTYFPLIVPSLGSVFAVYLYRQFFLTFPRELEDAAAIDGCSRFGMFWRIAMPTAQAATIAGAILIFTENWNAFLWPLLVAFTDEWKTLPVGMAIFTRVNAQGGDTQNGYGVAMAAVAVVALPTLIFFLTVQRYFIEGITQTGIKG